MLLLLAFTACDDGGTDTAACATSTLYRDLDGDGYGADDTWAVACDAEGWSSEPGDCDDDDPTAHPAADPGCDCVGEPARRTWYADADGDGAGDDEDVLEQCAAPDGYVLVGGDCAPDDETVGPLAEEIWYDGVDQDCDGASDFDQDQDGHDASDHGGTDCDDQDDDVHPDAAEVCDADRVDEDCDDLVNEDDPDARDWRTWYEDLDGDGHGTTANDVVACSPPDGYAAEADDCDDSAASVSPSAEEVCGNGVDDDCSDEPLQCGPQGESSLETAWSDPVNASAEAVLGDLGSGPEVVVATTAGQVTIGDLDGGRLELSTADEGWPFASALAVGDVDGDGQDDLVLGASAASTGSSYGLVVVHEHGLGAVDVVLDAAWVFTGRLDDVGYFGNDLLLADLADDGVADLVVSAPSSGHWATRAGEVSVFDVTLGSQDAYDADATVLGGAEDQLGVVAAGDLDGDGVPELILGADESSTGTPRGGLVAVGYGVADVVDVEDLPTVLGDSGSLQLGTALAAVDLDGDGLDEVLATATGYSGNRGALYVLDDLDAETLDDAAVGRVVGVHGTYLGTGVRSVGDVDEDGRDDLAVVADLADDGASNGGTVYLLSGPISGDLDVSEAAWAELHGDIAGGRLVDARSGADLTGDGRDDLVVSSYYAGVYVVPGGPGI